MESTADKRQQCMQYLATHQIDQVLKVLPNASLFTAYLIIVRQQLLVGLMVHRPKDPYQAIVDILTIARQEQAQGNPVDYKASITADDSYPNDRRFVSGAWQRNRQP
jgi:hypothetical protein